MGYLYTIQFIFLCFSGQDRLIFLLVEDFKKCTFGGCTFCDLCWQMNIESGIAPEEIAITPEKNVNLFWRT